MHYSVQTQWASLFFNNPLRMHVLVYKLITVHYFKKKIFVLKMTKNHYNTYISHKSRDTTRVIAYFEWQLCIVVANIIHRYFFLCVMWNHNGVIARKIFEFDVIKRITSRIFLDSFIHSPMRKATTSCCCCSLWCRGDLMASANRHIGARHHQAPVD